MEVLEIMIMLVKYAAAAIGTVLLGCWLVWFLMKVGLKLFWLLVLYYILMVVCGFVSALLGRGPNTWQELFSVF